MTKWKIIKFKWRFYYRSLIEWKIHYYSHLPFRYIKNKISDWVFGGYKAQINYWRQNCAKTSIELTRVRCELKILKNKIPPEEIGKNIKPPKEAPAC